MEKTDGVRDDPGEAGEHMPRPPAVEVVGQILLTFAQPALAAAAERMLLARGVPVKAAAVPTEISPGWGLCLPLEQAQRGTAVLAAGGIAVGGRYRYENGRILPEKEERPFTLALGLRAGDVTAVVGCGGKTSLVYRLAEENREKKVLLSTTTRMYRPPEDKVDRILRGPLRDQVEPGVNLFFTGEQGGKISGGPVERLEELCPPDGLALLECDGSRGLPLKGWADYEPVVPGFATVTVGVCALWALGMRVSPGTVHRPALFCALTGARMGEVVEARHLAAMIAGPGGMLERAAGRRVLLLNGTDAAPDAASCLWRALPDDFRQGLAAVAAGSLRDGACERLG